jgi:MoaA/NifB/PqqE/SkfB family radical SAM enzyme
MTRENGQGLHQVEAAGRSGKNGFGKEELGCSPKIGGDDGSPVNPPEFVPRLVFWELTTGCNLRCIHCRATAQELHPILILSGGEPLFRKDLFTIAAYAVERGLLVALASNGTLIDAAVAAKIRDSGIRRVAVSLDGVDAATHDGFRGISGSFEAAIRGMNQVRSVGVSTQINTTITRRNVHQLPEMLDLALKLGADALHTFLLVPVGCGVNIADDEMVPAEEYEKVLHWFYEREQEGLLELKATCAPHYYRVRKQRRVQERRAANKVEVASSHPGALGADLKSRVARSSNGGARSRHPQMGAVTKGCLAGSAVCFISHQGGVYPCGYLPVKAGEVRGL